MLGKFIIAALGGLTFSFVRAWGLFVRAKNFLHNFNWNTTDAALKAQIDASITAIAGQLGGTIGNAVGYISCGVLPGAAIYTFNPLLGSMVLQDVAAAALDEFASNVSLLIQSTFRLGVQILLTWLFTSARKLIKSQSKTIGKLFNSTSLQKAIEAWGEEGTKPWSFAQRDEDYIDSLQGAALQNFVEEYKEESWEGCVEAGFVVANRLDSFIAEQKLADQIAIDQQNIVVITPNRLVPDQKVIVAGSGIDLRNTITTTLATHQVMSDRDVGVIYGTDDEQPVRSLKPEVILIFYQAKADRIIGTKSNGQPASSPTPISMRISFRLMDKSEADFVNDTYAKQLATRIHALFATPPFRVDKGNQLFTYNDYQLGYQLALWVSGQGEARRVAEKLLDIQAHKFDSDKLRIGSRTVTPPKANKNLVVLGKPIEINNYGQTSGIVTFTHAYLNIGNGTPAINLVDLTGRRKNVVFKL
ncbi:MAG TPA: hypothetical protein VE956_13660 [Nodularia sp. (in: cyanobacteria)]|nr:hypothetical protein [Nodularia sp. (in: cyanobacteria)]